MKQAFKLFLAFFIIALVIFFACLVLNKIAVKKEIDESTSRLPNFTFEQISGLTYSKDNIPKNKNTVIINYFDPECEHCQSMAKQIVSNIRFFSNAQILMITNGDLLSTKHFINNYQLSGIKEVTVLRDPNSYFYKIWGSAVTPSFFIYKNGVIMKKIQGETKIQNILDAF